MNDSAIRSLDQFPQEVLEHIAFFSATERLVGPPSSLPSILVANRSIYSRISFTVNDVLYARIFAFKFDSGAVLRRLVLGNTNTSAILAKELVKRFTFLQQIRVGIASTLDATALVDEGLVYDILAHVYVMMLENESKNERQLREYAKMNDWLHSYWFNICGASTAAKALELNQWPPQNDRNDLAMWIFWFLLQSDGYNNEQNDRIAIKILKIYAIGAHKYPLTFSSSWYNSLPQEIPKSERRTVQLYSQAYPIYPPPLATPAILSFLTIQDRLQNRLVHEVPILRPNSYRCEKEWESEWNRCIRLSEPRYFDRASFYPGSIEGVWEGLFTYMEFTAYASLLGGVGPGTLERSQIIRHRQTWKLREHHFVDLSPPLSSGNPLRSYFPDFSEVKETSGGIQVRWNDKDIHYVRASYTCTSMDKNAPNTHAVRDVIITGEGHSAWGEFNLIGRVRPFDGFVSLTKEYVDGDRGKWLYRGYLVGNIDGNLAGRWRDTLSPASSPGYEGCFFMARRK